jgi:ATP-dependent Lon protease
VTKIILPAGNQRDMEEVPKELMGEIKFVFVENVRQVFDIALKEPATPPAPVPPRPKALPQPAPPTAH